MVGSNGRWHPRIRGMAVVWTLNVPDTGTGRVFSIEDRIWDGQRTSASASISRMLGQSQRTSRVVRTGRGRLCVGLKAPTLQMHFCARNVPYVSVDPCNPLKSQQMRLPSERTKRVTN